MDQSQVEAQRAQIAAKRDDLEAQLAKLKAENAELLSAQRGQVRLKVSDGTVDPKTGKRKSEGGGISLYGFGRFPITLYVDQWSKLLAMSATIQSFIDENKNHPKVIAATKRVQD